VFQTDCNSAVPAIHGVIPADALTLAFVDPTSWQVRLSTIEALTKDRRVDLLMTFHAGSMKRLARTASAPALDAFFGTGDWRAALKCPRPERMEALLQAVQPAAGTAGLRRVLEVPPAGQE
jgi:three-Cys-motif partner protein